MNYHLMIDNQFVNYFIKDAEIVSKPDANLYIIRGNIENATFVKHKKAIWALPGSKEFNELTRKISKNDKVFVHWLSKDACEFILTLPEDIPVYVVHWGGDFYDDPPSVHKNWLFDRYTKRYLNHSIFNSRKWLKNPLSALRQLKQNLHNEKNDKALFKIKKKAIQRINYILLHEANVGEVELTAKLYDAHQMKHLPFFYESNVDSAINYFNIENEKKDKCIIQLGNSATDTNNHLDAFNIIKKFNNENIELHLPLSYGSTEYQKMIMEEAISVFREKAVPITDFLSREEYIRHLSQIDIGIMYHNRSQAFGNCVTLLCMGKKLFIKNNNPLWKLFNKVGVKIFNANDIQKMTFEEFKRPLSDEDKNKNLQILTAFFSEEQRLNWVKQVLN